MFFSVCVFYERKNFIFYEKNLKDILCKKKEIFELKSIKMIQKISKKRFLTHEK